MCLIPAFIEEVFFRGCLQQLFLNWMKKTPMVAILLIAVIFSAFHGQLSGFFPRVFLGLLLGLAYYFSGSIWITIAMHALNNFITVLMVYLFNAKITTTDMTKLPDTNLWLGLSSGIAVIGLIYLFQKYRKPFELVEVDKTIEEPVP
jgi:membrane protease YdiL (CAAX protease family)